MKKLHLISLLTALSVSPNLQGQSETGGSGTIDPSTVATQVIVRDTAANNSTEGFNVRFLRTDPSGNYLVGFYANQQNTVARFPRGELRKYDPAGNVLWRRQRIITTSTNGLYYESFAPGQSVPIASDDAKAYLETAGVATDAQGNVVIGFDEEDYNPDGSSTQYLQYSGRTLLVCFDAAGQFRWRHLVRFENLSRLQKLEFAPDGSTLALINNFAVASSSGIAGSLAVRIAADGTMLFASRFPDLNRRLDYYSNPLSLVDDGAGNGYLVSQDAPLRNGYPDFTRATNVVRKLDAVGALAASQSFAATNGADQVTDTWQEGKADTATGRLYLAGVADRGRTSASSGDGISRQLVVALNPDLSLRWRALGPQPAQTAQERPRVTVANLRLSPGGITVGGSTESPSLSGADTDQHWEISRFAYADGALQWHRLYQSATKIAGSIRVDVLGQMEVDSADNVYAAGSLSGNPKNTTDLIKYAGNGTLQFVKPLPSAESSFTANQNLFVAGGASKPAFVSAGSSGREIDILTVDNPAVVAGAPSSLANIATRLKVGTGDNVLIGGFIVTGSSTATKTVLLRGIGPSLTGLAGTLSDPFLELHDSSGAIIASNDDWQQGDTSKIPAGFQPGSPKESVLVATIAAGTASYTAVLRGAHGETGVGVVEAYDLDGPATAQLANIATRGLVNTGDDVLIAGLIIGGDNSASLLLRAIGPSLQGITGALQNPSLTLVDGNGNERTNLNWRDDATQAAEIQATGAAPTDNREAALRVSLSPGNYTAVVRGEGNTTGVAVVEVYNLR